MLIPRKDMQDGDPENEECLKDDNDSTEKRKRSYYYDDAHGYEQYDPEKDAEVDDEEETDD